MRSEGDLVELVVQSMRWCGGLRTWEYLESQSGEASVRIVVVEWGLGEYYISEYNIIFLKHA